MPSRINSTTTSPGGLISTGDSDNSLLIQTGDTTAITISNTQVVSLTNPLPVSSGGTGANSNAAAPFALKGANSDITSITGLTTALSVAQGGTGANTATAAFNALNPMTTTGDIIYEASPTVAARLGIGSTGQVLAVSGGIPAWTTISVTPANGSITDPMIADVSGAGTAWTPFADQGTLVLNVDSTASTIKGAEFRALRGGTFRFRAMVFSDNPTGSTRTYNVYLYKNGVLASTITFTQANNSFTETFRTLPDITVARGDIISWYGQMNGSGTTMALRVYGGQYGTSTTTSSLALSLPTWTPGSPLYAAL